MVKAVVINIPPGDNKIAPYSLNQQDHNNQYTSHQQEKGHTHHHKHHEGCEHHHHHSCGHHHDHGDGNSRHWRRYIEHTSMHGVFQVQNSVTSIGKIVWMLIVMASLGGLSFMVRLYFR